MKQKDYALIVIIVIVSGVISYFVSGLLFGTPKNRQTEVEVVEKISTQFDRPDARYFNQSSIDPTQNITIGNDQNPQPFQSSDGN